MKCMKYFISDFLLKVAPETINSGYNLLFNDCNIVLTTKRQLHTFIRPQAKPKTKQSQTCLSVKLLL